MATIAAHGRRADPAAPASLVGMALASDAATDQDLGFFGEAALWLMEGLREPGAGIAIAIENLFPPIPSEVILPLAGFASSQGTLNLWLVLVWTVAGSLVGALALYGLGRLLGHDRMVRIANWLPLVDGDDIDKTVAWFQKHGPKAVFFGRFLPIFRSLISIPAGIEKMPLRVFVPLTFLGSAIWNSVFVVLGYVLGEQWHLVEPYVDLLQWVVIGAVLIAIALFVVLRLRRNRRRAREAAAAVAAE